ncbi:Aldedh-domain-containing protein [Hymenopellis radicata]|nr:Aldedh-domain-containing protein [Hymenopellis radicata]
MAVCARFEFSLHMRGAFDSQAAYITGSRFVFIQLPLQHASNLYEDFRYSQLKGQRLAFLYQFVDPVQPSYIDVINPRFLALNVESLLLERDREEFAAPELNVGNPFTFTQKYETMMADKVKKDYPIVRMETGVNAAGAVRCRWRSPSLELPVEHGEMEDLSCSRHGQRGRSQGVSSTLAAAIIDAGFPPGVVNIVNGYGRTKGKVISEYPSIRRMAFTGSTATGRRIQEASARTSLKAARLEL